MSDLAGTTRDFTVAVFVVWERQVLLHFHTKLNRWLPPGGHIEANELPDHAAVREVLEETGIEALLVGDQLNTVSKPEQPVPLCRPAGVQIAQIHPGHQHIDLVYFAQATGGEMHGEAGWFGPEAWSDLDLTEEVLTWCQSAIQYVDRWTPIKGRVRT